MVRINLLKQIFLLNYKGYYFSQIFITNIFLQETPVIAEKKRLEYSQVLEDAQKLQKTIESLAEEESDNDSYFSF